MRVVLNEGNWCKCGVFVHLIHVDVPDELKDLYPTGICIPDPEHDCVRVLMERRANDKLHDHS